VHLLLNNPILPPLLLVQNERIVNLQKNPLFDLDNNENYQLKKLGEL